MQDVKYYQKPIIIALIQWFLTTIFQVDRLYFTYDVENKMILTIKLLYLIFLIVGWCFIFLAIRKIKSDDVSWKRGFFVFKVYFPLLMLVMLLLWPGTWSHDDLWTLDQISTYWSWMPWHHILTGIYQDVFLQILPFPGGIILIQNIIIAICVAFTVTKLENAFNIGEILNPVVDIIVKLTPFLLPPVLMYQFSGYRMGLYLYVELVMLVMLICSLKDDHEWSLSYLLLFTFLCIISSTWRTESFFYIPAACLLLLFIKKTIIQNKRKVLCAIILIIGFMSITKAQNSELGNANYQVVSLLGPCAEVVRAADSEEDAKELAAIDKVADIEIILDNPALGGEALYWSTGCVRNRNDDSNDDYTDEDYSNFLKAFIKLSVKYPQRVVAERWALFIKGSGITGEAVTNVDMTARLFDADNESAAAQTIAQKGWIAYSPVFKQIRKVFVYMLGCRKPDGSAVGWLQKVVWNAIIPELVLIYAWIKMLVKKKWFLLGVCTAVLIRLPIVFLTQPAGWIMYALSFYLLGYVFLVYNLLAGLFEKN